MEEEKIDISLTAQGEEQVATEPTKPTEHADQVEAVEQVDAQAEAEIAADAESDDTESSVVASATASADGEEQHFGFVAIVGRPNVGKSTLMNHLIGQKVSITSRKPQTTRNRVLGIDTDGAYQTVYVDTPGLHKVEKRAINRLMNRAAESSLGDVELILWVVDATFFTDDDEMVCMKLQQAHAPVVLVINKIDKIANKEELLPLISKLQDKLNFKEIIPVSALKANNLESLKGLIKKALPVGPHCYSEDSITDRSMRFLAAETIREKLMRQMGDELPYSVTVEIEEYRTDEKGITHISAAILVERDGQKKMVIGSGGHRIKMIGTEARKDIEKLIEGKVFLSLFVKVKAGWADDERALKSLGYADFEQK